MGGVTDGAGSRWERIVVTYAQENGFPHWDRAPLRSVRDLLDVQGCLPDGWLIGMKAVHRGVAIGTRLSAGMAQCERALANLGRAGMQVSGVVPVQVLQRPGFDPAKAYAVTELGWLLELARLRRTWEHKDRMEPS